MTLLFPGWHLQTLRRKPKSQLQKMLAAKKKIERHNFSQLSHCLAKLIPPSLICLENKTDFSRRRIFSIENTFWGFFQQVLSADGGCKEIVNQFRLIADQKGFDQVSASTSAYCQSRKKLPQELLSQVLQHTQQLIENKNTKAPLFNRRVIVVDGTGVSMHDSVSNQTTWPQPKSQKIGCGFPQAKICALFDLSSGVALSYGIGNKKSHELPLLREQMDVFKQNDIFLGDRGFVSYFDMANLLNKEVDTLVGLARRKPITAIDANKIISENDLIVKWEKPKSSRPRYNLEEWDQLPNHLLVRQVKIKVDRKGYRPQEFYIATTLLDPHKYPAADLAAMYFKRWNVELYFRDLKTTLGMDVLRCRTPDMVLKEITMYFIVYNVIKLINYESIDIKDRISDSVSFKSSVQILNYYANNMMNTSLKSSSAMANLSAIVDKIKGYKLHKQEGRFEPRVVKRRPKPFKLLVKPRHILKAEMIGESFCETA